MSDFGSGNLWSNGVVAAILGSGIGLTGAASGVMVGVLAHRGRARAWVLGCLRSFLGLSAVMLLCGIAALALGQPYAVWYALLLPGVLGCTLHSFSLIQARRAYMAFERRRLEAVGLRS